MVKNQHEILNNLRFFSEIIGVRGGVTFGGVGGMGEESLGLGAMGGINVPTAGGMGGGSLGFGGITGGPNVPTAGVMGGGFGFWWDNWRAERHYC